MRTSHCFERVIFFDQNRAAEDLYDAQAHRVFASEYEQSWVEVYKESSPPHRLSAKHIGTKTKERALGDGPDDDGTLASQKHLVRAWETIKFIGLQELRDGFESPQTGSIFCFIRQRNSISRLSINKESFHYLMCAIGIFRQFKYYLLCFGRSSGDVEVGPPQLRFRFSPEVTPGLVKPSYECGYVLRFVELNRRNEQSPWSLRQSAVYQTYRRPGCSSCWLFIALSEQAQDTLRTYLSACEDFSAINPFEVHVILLDIVMANWRSYLIYLASETNEQADRVIMADVEGDGPIRVTDLEERQGLKQVEDKLLDLEVVFASTIDTIDTLAVSYKSFRCRLEGRPIPGKDEDEDLLYAALLEKRRDLCLLIAKLAALRSKVQGTSQLVSNLLDLGNGHSLKTLAEEARVENSTMRKLTEKATADAAAVKVLTIMTLVYLPATVVSNFFSTSFVKQVGDTLIISNNAWIFVAASVPLTVITLYVWWFYVQKQVYGRYPAWWRSPWKHLSPVFGNGARVRRLHKAEAA